MKAKRRVVPANAAGRPAARTRSPSSRSFPPRVRLPEPAARAATADEARAGADPHATVDALGGRPVDLAVDLGRGLVLANPILGAAGAFGYGVEAGGADALGRLGALCTRSTTLRPRAGHPGPRMAAIPAGLLNGVGLHNPGVEAVAERYGPAWRDWTLPIIVSVAGEAPGEFAECARRLEGVPGVAAFELNLGCASRGGTQFALDPDAAASVVSAVRRATDLPILAKLSPGATDVRAIARAVEAAGADAITAVNTLTGLALAPGRDRPALGSGYGGISGPALRPVALRVVFEVAQVVDIPVVAAGGVAAIDDVLDFLAVGAIAVQVGTAALGDPALPARLVDELADACRTRGLADYRALVGTALPKRATPPSTRGAEYRP